MHGDFKVNDPVHVERDSQQLEGVVAYVGAVQFADGDDWIGVRLTGGSVGLGKNDGSVKGVSYFSCGPNCGVFVRRSHVVHRTLTRLEELRLKRELAAAAGGSTAEGSSASSITASPRPSSSTTPTRHSTPTTAKSPPRHSTAATTTTSASKTKSRLEEIRERRAALAQKSTTVASARSSISSASEETTKLQLELESSQKEIVELKKNLQEIQKQLEQLKMEYQSKDEENASLQQALSKAEQALHDAKTKETEKQPAIRMDMDSSEVVMQLQEQLREAQDERRNLEDQLDDMQRRNTTLDKDLKQERKEWANDVEQLTQVRTELSALQHEWQARSDKADQRKQSDALLYKEQARLQAQVGSLTRKIQELESEKMDMEGTLEELTLDKEQLQEEKETLQDRLEEVKIDAETAQMEVEELRLELEDAKAKGETAASESVGAESSSDADDMAQALSVQNARLREALIRLREQSTVEKMELSRELRDAEKDAAAGKALSAEIESLRSGKSLLEEQIRDLKEMVEQGSAFESMVESLSDRLLLLEDENMTLQSTIQELEEAADITAEMEEIQADENKALMRDLESRDAIIRNLEEAIKMQRRREEDFQTTVSNFRKSVELLKQEKASLIAMQEGGEGEKSDLIAASQKALSRAAQLVTDAAESRRLEAEAEFARIEAVCSRHLAQRLESLLPQSHAGQELAAIKGEMQLSAAIGKASRLLHGISTSFTRNIQRAVNESVSAEDMSEPANSVPISDESFQSIAYVAHQTDFAIATVDSAAELLKLLAAGQWPDLVSPDGSQQLGARISFSEMDVAFGNYLRMLKEEGVLSPQRANLAVYQQIMSSSLLALRAALETQQDIPLSPDWKPVGWQLFKDASTSRFSCLGCAAIVGAIVHPGPFQASTDVSVQLNVALGALKGLVVKMEELSAESARVCRRLAGLDTFNEKMVADLSSLANEWNVASTDLLRAAKESFLGKSEFPSDAIKTCETKAETATQVLVRFSSALREAGLNREEGTTHALSAEVEDSWEAVTKYTQHVRAVDGDKEDINYLMRARALQSELTEAIENGPKLSIANSKIAGLEKSLASRSKEVAMQNVRLDELEKLLAKTSAQPSQRKTKSAEISSAEEIASLKEENRVLSEAMDVLQRQVDDYEQNLRTFTSPKGAQRPQRRSTGLMSPLTSTTQASESVPSASSGLEAALFRPALNDARRSAALWKANAASSMLHGLPPLPMHVADSSNEKSGAGNPSFAIISAMTELSSARSFARIEKASVSVVNLSKSVARPMEELLAVKATASAAERYLHDANLSASYLISQLAPMNG